MPNNCEYVNEIFEENVESEFFGGRLKQERQRIGLTQMDFFKKTKVSHQTQIDYERGQRIPRIDYLYAAEALGVNLGTLLIEKPLNTDDTLASRDTRQFHERLVVIREAFGLNQTHFALQFDVGRQTLQNYEYGKAQPKATFLLKLAAMQVDIIWLVTGWPMTCCEGVEALPPIPHNPAALVKSARPAGRGAASGPPGPASVPVTAPADPASPTTPTKAGLRLTAAEREAILLQRFRAAPVLLQDAALRVLLTDA